MQADGWLDARRKTLRLQQLDRGLGPLRAAGNLPRPQRGWLRAVREAVEILEPRAWDFRRGCLDALRAADQADIRPLLAFARS